MLPGTREERIAPGASQTKSCGQQGTDCWYGELVSGLGKFVFTKALQQSYRAFLGGNMGGLVNV